jgi:hypothetical protein
MSLTFEVRATPSHEWSLRVKTPAGIGVEYRYPTEEQARFMAAVLALGPAKLPPAHKVISLSIGKKRQRSAPHPELDDVTGDEIDGALGVLSEPIYESL